MAATFVGHAYPPTATFTNKTIFDLLEAAGVSWKIYETDPAGSYINMSSLSPASMLQILCQSRNT